MVFCTAVSLYLQKSNYFTEKLFIMYIISISKEVETYLMSCFVKKSCYTLTNACLFFMMKLYFALLVHAVDFKV